MSLLVKKKLVCQCKRYKRHGFNPWVRKIPWRRKCNHSSILVWKILWTEEPSRLQSIGYKDLDMTEVTQHYKSRSYTKIRDSVDKGATKVQIRWNSSVTTNMVALLEIQRLRLYSKPIAPESAFQQMPRSCDLYAHSNLRSPSQTFRKNDSTPIRCKLVS